jgi:preprotein translocase subunit Sec61beta
LETTFVLASGAIIAFIFTKENRDLVLFRISMLLISSVSLYGLWRYGLHRKIVRIHETYIKEQIEPLLRSERAKPLTGLVSYYDTQKSRPISSIGKPTTSGGLKTARYVLWIGLLIAPLLAIVWSFCDPQLFGLLAKPK